MIHLLCANENLREILHKALIRSFTRSQIRIAAIADLETLSRQKNAWVIADAQDSWSDAIIQILDTPGSKCLLLGAIPPRLAKHLGVVCAPQDFANEVSCPAAAMQQSAESAAIIRYRSSMLGASPLLDRACLRYDFTDEWNNLGYGAIRGDGSIWSLAQKVTGAPTLTDVEIGGKSVSAYAALWENNTASLLWFNRAAGPVDSQEWRLVEQYFSQFHSPNALCFPTLSEIPQGYDAAVTMRLDCDEDIASAEALFDMYRGEKIPFSLAVCTKLLADARHVPLLRAVAEQGSILTHSATHPADWGGNYEEACRQVADSRQALAAALPGVRVDYAVSPFHQNPLFSIKAMAASGLSGFIGGIIRNDPEYLMARGGELPFGPPGFIGHSQQCMLHGDCPENYAQSFDLAQAGGALFGYLDHPFSERYAYGWSSESERQRVHKTLIDHMRNTGNTLFLSQNDALDWIRHKASAEIRRDEKGRFSVHTPLSSPWKLKLSEAA